MKNIEKIIELFGTIASPGWAEGRVHIYGDMTDFKKGSVLISQYASTDVAEYIADSAGIISENGGTLCHLAIVARELGIPCLVGVKGVTSFFKMGDNLRLEAGEEFNGIGRVYKVPD